MNKPAKILAVAASIRYVIEIEHDRNQCPDAVGKGRS